MAGTAVSFQDFNTLTQDMRGSRKLLLFFFGGFRAERRQHASAFKKYLRVPALIWKLSNSSIFVLQNWFERELHLLPWLSARDNHRSRLISGRITCFEIEQSARLARLWRRDAAMWPFTTLKAPPHQTPSQTPPIEKADPSLPE